MNRPGHPMTTAAGPARRIGPGRARAHAAASLVASLVAVVALLAGCALAPQPIVTRLPTDGTATRSPLASSPSPSITASPSITSSAPPPSAPAAPDAGELDCAGAPLTLTDATATRVVGDCPELRVEGAGLDVDATGARVGTLATAGDRIAVRVAEVSSVLVQGNDVSVSAAGIGAVEVNGDRNRVSTAGDIPAVTVRGNGNTVSGDGIGAVVVEGSGNSVG